MYACVLIPRELSLVLTLHPNPVHMLEMSATIWSNTHLSPGAIFYPDEGDVRLDRIESRTVIPDEDIRRFYGCYDAIMNINGQEVRHCNWVRFVKTTTNPDDANIISSKVRGQSFYQVIRPIKPNEEIIVLFHLTAERTFYDVRPQPQFSSYSPNVCSPLSGSDMQNSRLLHQTGHIKPNLITSTPLSTKMALKESHSNDFAAQRNILKFCSSSSSSFTSHLDTSPNYHFQIGNHHESSFTSPLYTSNSSRETTSSDNTSCIATQESSFEKGRNQEDNASDKKNTTDKGDNSEIENDETCQTPAVTYDQQKETEVDVVNLTSAENDLGNNNGCHDLASENSLDDAAANGSVDIRSAEEGDKEQRTTSKVAPPERIQTPGNSMLCNKIPWPILKERRQEFPQDFVQKDLVLKTSPDIKNRRQEPPPQNFSQHDVETRLVISEVNSEESVSGDHQSQAATIDDKVLPNNNLGLEKNSSNMELDKNNEKDIVSSCDEKPFSFKLSVKAKSQDLQTTGSRDLSQLKRCRERTWWSCDICCKKFDRPSLLKRHTRTHTGEKPHACDVCGKAFSTSSSLNTHRRIHSGEKPHQCKTCGKRFTASSNLYYHRMTHNKEKPHKCDLCSKSFPTPGDLRSHMYIHNGSWPFKCDVCNRGFSKQTNLKNHMLLHSGDKPHECNVCEKKFALLCNLRTHMKTHENSDSSDCTECLKCGAAMEISDETHENICKRCSESSRRFTPKLLTPSLPSCTRQKRHTDFSISKLTSSDGKNTIPKSERHFALVVPPAMICGDVKSEAPQGIVTPASINPHHQVPVMYRQFFTPAIDQNKWLIPSQPQFVPGRMTHPVTLYGGFIKNEEKHPTTNIPKIDATNNVNSSVPAFVTPEMMSLRGGSMFPSVSSFPTGFSLNHGHLTWGGHVIARGF